MERKALIFNVQKYNMYDGPGIRTLIFFKGCPLRCQWCSNPEGQIRQPQVLFKKDQCVQCGSCVRVCPTGHVRQAGDPCPTGRARRTECTGCRQCEQACPRRALAVTGEEKTISELLAVIMEDKPFYDTSAGGVTLGGGEALMQPEAANNLLIACKENGVGTALETSGYARPEVIMTLAENTDIFLFDLKHMHPETHHALTGVRNEGILGNLRLLLENHHNVTIRRTILKGVNDDESETRELLRFLEPYQGYKNFKGIDLLPYHKLGVNKYSQLGWEYPLPGHFTPSDEALDRLARSLGQMRIPVSVVRH